MNTIGVVYVVDDDEAIRDAMRLLLNSAGLSVQTYPSASGFLADYDSHKAGCLVVDVRMPEMTGLELLQKLSAQAVALPVIVMTGHGDIRMAVQAMKSGAFDFLEKPFDDEALLQRVRECLQAQVESKRWQRNKTVALGLLSQLSPREREIADLLADGKFNKEIAAELDISVRTVEVHRARVMAKLQAKSVADIVHLVLLLRGNHPVKTMRQAAK